MKQTQKTAGGGEGWGGSLRRLLPGMDLFLFFCCSFLFSPPLSFKMYLPIHTRFTRKEKRKK